MRRYGQVHSTLKDRHHAHIESSELLMLNRLSDLIRLICANRLSSRDIASSLDIAKTTVNRYRHLVEQKGVQWDDLSSLSASELSALFNQPKRIRTKVRPDFEVVGRRRHEPGMTLLRLWEEYRIAEGAGSMCYSQFARQFRDYRGTPSAKLRQDRPPGWVACVDYSGERPCYINRETGEEIFVELFVGVLGASSYTFVYCTESQTIPDWLEANTRMLEFFGGVPETIVPDNLKSAITKAGREPTIQRHYLEWASHYNTAILPARPAHPSDKGLVEGAVLIVQRAMLPELNKHTFFSLDAINEHVAELLPKINGRLFQREDDTRLSKFDRVERSALKPLPAQRYVFKKWMTKQLVPPDYHVAVNGHFYSVPHTLIGKPVEACMTSTHVEIHHDGKVVATHLRKSQRGGHTTMIDHQPESHQAMAQRTPEHLEAWASSVGPAMTRLMLKQFQRKVPLQGLPSALALRNMEKVATAQQLELAATQALLMRMPSTTGVRRYLIADKRPKSRLAAPDKKTRVPLSMLAQRPHPPISPPTTGLRS
jgi:transposase